MNPSAAKKVGDYAQKFRKNWTSDDRFKGMYKTVVYVNKWCSYVVTVMHCSAGSKILGQKLLVSL